MSTSGALSDKEADTGGMCCKQKHVIPPSAFLPESSIFPFVVNTPSPAAYFICKVWNLFLEFMSEKGLVVEKEWKNDKYDPYPDCYMMIKCLSWWGNGYKGTTKLRVTQNQDGFIVCVSECVCLSVCTREDEALDEACNSICHVFMGGPFLSTLGLRLFISRSLTGSCRQMDHSTHGDLSRIFFFILHLQK